MPLFSDADLEVAFILVINRIIKIEQRVIVSYVTKPTSSACASMCVRIQAKGCTFKSQFFHTLMIVLVIGIISPSSAPDFLHARSLHVV